LQIIKNGEKILFKMSDRKYKSLFYQLVFNEIILTKYFATPPTITLENGII